ncbi:MAG: RidA family protein [Microscillaceae bacterium]|nr:RidA family protein [Microscillaceae bacterium]
MNRKIIIRSEQSAPPIGPYSQAVMVNGMLFTSGQIALTPQGALVNESIEAETHQVMKNLEAILMEAQMDFNNVVKCTIFLRDMSHFQAVNEVYGSYFYTSPPARETVEVSRLPKDVSVEISCIAIQMQPDFVS